MPCGYYNSTGLPYNHQPHFFKGNVPVNKGKKGLLKQTESAKDKIRQYQKGRKKSLAIPAEDVEYVESVRIYNVKVPIFDYMKAITDANICFNCGKKMKRVKGQKYSWKCDCMPDLILSKG